MDVDSQLASSNSVTPLFDLPLNVWAVVASHLSVRAVAALRLTCRAVCQLIDAQLLLSLRLALTVPWIVSHRRSGCRALLARRFTNLQELLFYPANAKDCLKRVDVTTCVAILGPCRSLRVLHLSGWPLPYQIQLYSMLPYWAPTLKTLVLEGAAASLGDGDVVRRVLASGLPSLQRLAVRFGPLYEQKLPYVCPELGSLTQLTALQLAGVVPNQATVSSLDPLTGLRHLHLELLHDGYDKAMQVLDLRNHSHLTSLVLRARSVRQWDDHDRIDDTLLQHHYHRRHCHQPSASAAAAAQLPIHFRRAAATSLPCPAALRRTLQHLPRSLESLAVDLPPWRPRMPPPLPPLVAAPNSTGSPALRFLACPPDLLPCLLELGIDTYSLASLRLSAVQSIACRSGGIGGSLAALKGCCLDGAMWQGAVPRCWSWCRCGCADGGNGGGAGWEGGADTSGGATGAGFRASQHHASIKSAAALIAVTEARGLYGGCDIIAALGCLPTHLLRGPEGPYTADETEVEGAAPAAARSETIRWGGGADIRCGAGDGGAAVRGDSAAGGNWRPLQHLEINARVGSAHEEGLMQLLRQLTATASAGPVVYNNPAATAATTADVAAAITVASVGRPSPTATIADARVTGTATIPGGSAAAAATATTSSAAAITLDLQLSVERGVSPAATLPSLASAAGDALRHLALFDLDMSYSSNNRRDPYTSYDGCAAAASEPKRDPELAGAVDGGAPPDCAVEGRGPDQNNPAPLRLPVNVPAGPSPEDSRVTGRVLKNHQFLVPAASLLAAVCRLRQLRSLTLQPVRNLLLALRVLAGHPALRVLRLLSVEEDGAYAADWPLLPHLQELVLALGGGEPWVSGVQSLGDVSSAVEALGDDPWVGDHTGACSRAAAAASARGGLVGREKGNPWVLLVVPQLLVWEVEMVNRGAEAATGGKCTCELLSGA